MNERDRLQQVQSHLQLAPRVLYLEGVSDVELFFALLGVERPASGIHDEVYVCGLESGGSGAKGVRACVAVAQKNGLNGVYGVIDGDGRDLATLKAEFEHPFPGPLFSWKAYCIENMAAKAAWPASWGTFPSFNEYAPYVAFNRVQRELHGVLRATDFTTYTAPRANQPLDGEASLRELLATRMTQVSAVDTTARYDDELAVYRDAVTASEEEAHTLFNGKWLVEHHACEVTKRSKAACRAEWVSEIRYAGGLTEVRDWWQRVVTVLLRPQDGGEP